MRKNRLFMVAAALTLLLPATTEAQEPIVVYRPARLGILTEPVGTPFNARERVVVDVVAGSAAEKAGVQKGDTILRFNGLPASQQVMSAPFEAGDTITLRLRRGGSERDVRVVAEAAPQGGNVYSFALPDTVLGRMSIIMDRVRSQMDSVHMPAIRIERGDRDSTVIMTWGDDSTRVFAYRPGRLQALGTRGDSMQVFRFGDDSVTIRRWLPDSAAWRAMHMPDSVWLQMRRDMDEANTHMFRALELDSVRLRVLRSLEDLPPMQDSAWRSFDRVFRFGTEGDTLHFTRPGQIFASGFAVGMRAVAGAELSELNPGLSEYFGTDRGVLVLNAREGTPAARAGLRAGDVITQVDGQDVRSIADIRRLMVDTPRAQSVDVRVLRRGERITVKLPLR